MKKFLKIVLVMLVLSVTSIFTNGCSPKEATNATAMNGLEEIINKGYIEVVTEPYFAPYEFIDPAKSGDERYVGSDIELAKYIADKLGVELKIIPLEFSAVLSSITEGKYNLAISALAYTPARAEAMIMSDGYYFSEDSDGYGLLIREEDRNEIKEPTNLAEKIVVAQSGSLQEVFVNEQIPKYKEFKRVSSTMDGILMVEENKADSCVVSIPMAQLYIEANPGSGLTIVDDFEFEVDKEYGGTRVGITLGEDELEQKINEIIDEVVSSGQYEAWYKEYTEYAKKLGL